MISTRIDRLADRLYWEFQKAEHPTAYHHGIVRVVAFLDSLEAKLRRRGF